jgi:hypothetical protein
MSGSSRSESAFSPAEGEVGAGRPTEIERLALVATGATK